MNRYRHLRDKAMVLRAKGKSLGEICRMLVLPRGTVYYWIKGTTIPRTVAQTRAQKIGTAAGKSKWRTRRQGEYERGCHEAKALLRDLEVRDFVALYVGEGTRSGRWEVGVSNSNPAVIKMAARLLGRFSSKPPKVILQVHTDHDRAAVLRYWSKELGIEPTKIFVYQKANQSFLKTRNWRSAYGTAKIRVWDTLLRARLQGWLDYLLAQWNRV